MEGGEIFRLHAKREETSSRGAERSGTEIARDALASNSLTFTIYGNPLSERGQLRESIGMIDRSTAGGRRRLAGSCIAAAAAGGRLNFHDATYIYGVRNGAVTRAAVIASPWFLRAIYTILPATLPLPLPSTGPFSAPQEVSRRQSRIWRCRLSPAIPRFHDP